MQRDMLKKKRFITKSFSAFARTLGKFIAREGEWTVKGFVDVFKNVYTISSDTKVISKILELHLFPRFLEFANAIGYEIELATHQNRYPDLTFINKSNRGIIFCC